MEAPGEAAEAVLDDNGTICADLSCRRCGYNLRGLNHEGRCPECGTPIGLSCLGDLLRYADPGWVETLGRGASFILWGALVALVAGVAAAVLSGVTRDEAAGTAVGIVGGLVGLYGAWLITARDPSGIGEDRYVTDRKLVRITLVFGLAAQFLDLLAKTASLPRQVLIALVVAAVLAALVGVVGEFAKLHYYGKLALRIPAPDLAKRARSLRWAMAISLGVLVLAGGGILIVLVATGLPGPGGAAPGAPGFGPRGALGGILALACLVGAAGIANLVVVILVLILVYRLRRAFREQAAVARAGWAAAGSAES